MLCFSIVFFVLLMVSANHGFRWGRPAGELVSLNRRGAPYSRFGAPRVPSCRRVEFTYQQSSLLYESALGLKSGSVWDFLVGLGCLGRLAGVFVAFSTVLPWICVAFLLFSLHFLWFLLTPLLLLGPTGWGINFA